MANFGKDKRPDYIHAYEVASREARAEGKLDEAAILESRANALRFHIDLHPELPVASA